jgi:hypothetical protein
MSASVVKRRDAEIKEDDALNQVPPGIEYLQGRKSFKQSS